MRSEASEITGRSPVHTPDYRTLHELVSPERDTGNGYHITTRHYPCDEAEVCAIKLTSEDSLKRGGGARRKATCKEQMTDLVATKSANRARTKVRRTCLEIGVDRLMTLTFKENVTEIDDAWKKYKYFCKLMKQRYGERWAYVAVPEYQKRGAVHFHLAVSGYYHANTVRYLWLRAVGEYGGNIDITSPRKAGKNSWSPKRVANYITKYITKTDSVEFNRRRYSSGGNIQRVEPIRGWIAFGVPIISVMRQIVESLSRRRLDKVVEIDGYFHITYVST
jgi:hypothetical protein